MISELSTGLPDIALVTNTDSMAAYRFDLARFVEAGVPIAVVRPTETGHVAHAMAVAAKHRIPVVAQGARTGLAGAANAVDGCIVIDLSRMDRILEINKAESIAVVQPGVFNAVLSSAVLEQGMFYPPDPSSWEISTIGGNIGTGAGGLACVKYGVTRDFVRALEVVLADGSVIRTGRRTAKGVAGYDLTALMVGSEGTLGIVTEATLALVPAPAPALTVSAVFASTTAALEAVNEIMAGEFRPSLLEFLDSVTIKAINGFKNMGFPDDAQAIVIGQSDRGSWAADDVTVFAKIFEQHGAVDVAVASDQMEADMLLEARRIVHWAIESLGATLVEDICVPRPRLPELLDGIRAVSERTGLTISGAGHVGDANMHPTVVYERGNPDSERAASAAFSEIMALAIDLGGTITGEHGVGVLKKDWLARELGPRQLELQRAVKAAFDPHGLLNPGKVL